MGVKNFTTYINKTNIGSPFALEKSEKKRIIGIDGLSFIYTVAELPNNTTARSFREFCLKFFALLKSLNFEVLIFMDGFTPESKVTENMERFKNRWSKYSGYSEDLFKKKPLLNINCFPLLISEFKSICQVLDLGFRISTEEADDDMVEWVSDNPDAIYGIISNDSDFYFYNFGKTFFFPISKIKVDFQQNQINVVAFNNEILAEGLKVPAQHLGFFTALLGNETSRHFNQGGNYRRQFDQQLIPNSIAAIHSNLEALESKSITYETILKENFQLTNDSDVEKIMNSIGRYSVKSDKSKGSIDERTQTFLRTTDRRDRVLSSEFGKYLFSVNSGIMYLCDYIFLDESVKVYQNYSMMVERRVPLKTSFLYCIGNIKSKFFGYTTENKDVIVKDLHPDQPNSRVIEFNPAATPFTFKECWNSTIPFETRIKEFTSLFTLTSSITDKFTSPVNFNFYQFYLYNCLGFIINLNETNSLQIELSECSFDTIILQSILCRDVSEQFKELENYKKSFLYEPFYFLEIYAKLLEQCFNLTELFALNKDVKLSDSEKEKVCRPSNLVDREILHNLWNMKLENENSAKKIIDHRERVKALFPSLKLTDQILNEYVEIRNNLQPIFDGQVINQLSNISLKPIVQSNTTSNVYVPPSQRKGAANTNTNYSNNNRNTNNYSNNNRNSKTTSTNTKSNEKKVNNYNNPYQFNNDDDDEVYL